MYSKEVHFAWHNCNNYKLYCNCTNDKIQTSTCLGNNICLCCNFPSLDEVFRRLFTTIILSLFATVQRLFVATRNYSSLSRLFNDYSQLLVTIRDCSRYSLFAIRIFQTPVRKHGGREFNTWAGTRTIFFFCFFL